jgi:hypothetical protein
MGAPLPASLTDQARQVLELARQVRRTSAEIQDRIFPSPVNSPHPSGLLEKSEPLIPAALEQAQDALRSSCQTLGSLLERI